MPIIAGGKVNGRVANTNVGALVVGTDDREGVVDDEAVMGVARLKQNLWRESWLGGIATVGDPLGGSGRWLVGGDFTYATSRLRGDKNFLVGVWGLATDQQVGNDSTAYGVKVDYPNDKWDIALNYKRIGRDFNPALGFVPRPAVQLFNLGIDNRTRIAQRAVPAAGARVPTLRRHRSRRGDGRATACSSRRSTGAFAAATASSSTPIRPASGWSPPSKWRRASSSRPGATTGSNIASRSARPRNGGFTPR